MKGIFKKTLFGFLFIYLCGYKSVIVIGEVFTLGYLTGSQRRAGNLEYAKPGTVIFFFFSNILLKKIYYFHFSGSH